MLPSESGNNNIACYNAPNGFHYHGGNPPVRQLVDDLIKDGSKFSWINHENAMERDHNRERN